MDAVPEQGGKGLGPLVAQILVLVPGPSPPPVPTRSLIAGVLGDAAGDGQGRVEGLEPGGQRVHQGHVVATRGGHHRQAHPHPRAGLHMPDAMLVLGNVRWIVHALVGALHGKALIHGRQFQAGRRIAQAQPVVEPTVPFLAQDQVLRSLSFDQVAHGHGHRLIVGAAAPELESGHILVSQPDPRHKVGRLCLIDVKVAIQGQQDKDILLSVAPAAPLAMGQQAAHDLGDQVAIRVHQHQPLQDDAVGPTVGGQ